MALHPERKKKRDAKIQKRFDGLLKKTTPAGKQLFTVDAIIEKLSYEFDLSEFTIEQIIRKR
jgi:hypothetical protein